MMKNLSPETKSLIAQLSEPVGLWDKLTSRKNIPGIIESIARAEEPAAIPSLLPYVLDGRMDVARTAASSIGLLLGRVRPADFVQLEYLVRKGPLYSQPDVEAWDKLQPSEVERVEKLGVSSASLLGLLSCHHRGQVREAAIHRLAAVHDGSELPFLLIRLNDWVGEVRSAARHLADNRIKTEYAAHFIDNLPLVLRLTTTGREDHSPFVEKVLHLLQRPECQQVLARGLIFPDRHVRRVCYDLALDATGVEGSLTVVERALSDPDTVIRLSAVRRLANAADANVLLNTLQAASRDPFMPVRREALRILGNRFPQQAEDLYREALLDSHPSMREVAQRYLHQHSSINVQTMYREAMMMLAAAGTETKKLAAAVSGLGEVGTPDDALTVLSFISHRTGAVRAATVRSLAKLNGDRYVEEFMPALEDNSPAVSRIARQSLERRARSVGGERLWQIFTRSTLRHVRRNVLSLFVRLDKWESIYYLALVACSEEDDLSHLAQLLMRRWLVLYNRSFSRPSQVQIKRLSDALTTSSSCPSLDENIKGQLLFALKTFTPTTAR